jgi:hypothetical protein
MADRDPLRLGRASRGRAQHPQGLLCEGTTGVTQERDDRWATGVQLDGKAGCAIARPWRREEGQGGWREEGPRVHESTVTPFARRLRLTRLVLQRASAALLALNRAAGPIGDLRRLRLRGNDCDAPEEHWNLEPNLELGLAVP